ncbi:probable WRKY transcription factor 41 [Musa acuminata AAA Group]|uniref:probable WRKY transcription factor 41 n=1 Tax=Musa acuminata AAA Group TaxID=214697 RepID=UPI0031D28F2D
MENSTGCKHRSLLLAELARAQHLALQLVAHRDQHSPIESFKSLASNIVSSIDKLIHIAGSSTSEAKQQLAFPNTVPEDPLRSANKDASAGNFDSVFHRNCNNLSKNRKTLPKKKIQVTVGSGGVAAALDDGYSWRKYGNKNILGSKHSRSYYRCRDRNTKSCFATKQVQRSDEDPQGFDVIYQGTHTCCRGLPVPTTASISGQERRQNQPDRRLQNDQRVQQPNKDLLMDFQTGMDLDTHESSLSFWLGSVTAKATLPESINGYSSQPSKPDNCCFGRSPSASELIDISGSPNQLCHSEAGLEPLASDSYVSDSLTPPNSAVDADIRLLEFDTQFGEFSVSCSNLFYTM